MAGVLNMAGAMSGTAVAATIGKGIVKSEVISLVTVAAAMVAIIVWSTLAWRYGLPTSESHALVAGLTGAGLAAAGPEALLWAGWQKVLLGLVFSTFLGFGGGGIIIVGIFWIFRRSTPRLVRKTFGKLQVLSAAFMAFGHGSNDGQKFIGVFTLALLLGGVISEFHVSWQTIVLLSTVIGLGTAVGGWRIIKTMGTNLVKLEPHHGFAAETGAAAAIQVASVLGIPLSTTHTINMAIMGVGASQRLSAVRWGVAGKIIGAWVLTFPACGLIAWVVAIVLGKIF
jgi:PiT family inorganic phosphate transporter